VICPRLKENLKKKNGATINQPKKKICCLSSTHVIILIHISSIRIDNEENSTYTAAQTEGFLGVFCGWRHLSHDPAIMTIRGAKREKKQKLDYTLDYIYRI
jgi:hypothetical protein